MRRTDQSNVGAMSTASIFFDCSIWCARFVREVRSRVRRTFSTVSFRLRPRSANGRTYRVRQRKTDGKMKKNMELGSREKCDGITIEKKSSPWIRSETQPGEVIHTKVSRRTVAIQRTR